MKYNEFKKARKFGKEESNKALLDKISQCEEILDVCNWLKSNENKGEDGKPRYTASITVNIHGRTKDDANEKDLRSMNYPTNLDFVESRVRENYDKLIQEFEEKTKD